MIEQFDKRYCSKNYWKPINFVYIFFVERYYYY